MATVATASGPLTFATPHGLSAGSAVVVGNELRFVESVPSTTSAVLCAPLSAARRARWQCCRR
jgi:hypothetical protein